jgi:L-alanine-DL-glutamate epimerase-like enolase superfamily enzyme
MQLSWQIVRLNLKETFSIAYGDYSFRDALIVSLKKHNAIGYGECTAVSYYHVNLNDFLHQLKAIQPILEKKKMCTPKEFYQELVVLPIETFLLSALDCAYWDLYGKLEQKNFLELNAITSNSIPDSSITISIADVATQIKKITTSNWSRFKIKCKGFHEKDIQKVLGLSKEIALDTNGSFTKEESQRLEHLESANHFQYVEQPMAVGFDNYSVLSRSSNVNWMADEDCQTIEDLEHLQPHYKSINVKLMKCGGLTPALELIKKAKEMQFKVMIGCMTESTIGISAGAVLAPLCDFADLDGANLIANDFAIGSSVVSGKIALTDKPGLGIKCIV